MTAKKERILFNALELFATSGYDAVATSKIAKKAEVSEGLIFRHFKHKKGLLEAIMEQGEVQMNILFEPILSEQEPKKIIKKTIELPFSVKEEAYDFWKLQFKLKWEADFYNPNKMDPIRNKLIAAFKTIGYKKPMEEASLLLHIIEAISISIIREGLDSQKSLKSFLIEKYKV